jgi:hypothetical protein
MENIELSYVYRDGNNFKKFASVVFSNPERMTIGSVTEKLKQAFDADGLFIAGQIRLPEVFLWADGRLSYDDHCYHQLDTVRVTADAPSDTRGRSIWEFITEATTQASHGWRAFDPCDSQGSYGWLLASR